MICVLPTESAYLPLTDFSWNRTNEAGAGRRQESDRTRIYYNSGSISTFEEVRLEPEGKGLGLRPELIGSIAKEVAGDWIQATGSTRTRNLEVEQLQRERLGRFTHLIHERHKYIQSLATLPADWISGGGLVPDQHASHLARACLNSLLHVYLKRELLPLPDLLMGPIPTGGIQFDLRLRGENSITLVFRNGGSIELEYEREGHYAEVTVSDEWQLEPLLEWVLCELTGLSYA